MQSGLERIINCGPASGKRKLVIGPQFLFYGSTNKEVNTENSIAANEIAAYKFGIRWLKLDVTFGRAYKIDIKTTANKITKIRFNRYFSIGATKAHQLYSDILTEINSTYFSDIENNLLSEFNDGKEINIDRVSFNDTGIVIKTDFKKTQLLWDDIRTKDYYSYFAIYSVNDPANTNFTFSYADDWNTTLLYGVLRTLLQNKKIEHYQ